MKRAVGAYGLFAGMDLGRCPRLVCGGPLAQGLRDTTISEPRGHLRHFQYFQAGALFQAGMNRAFGPRSTLCHNP